MKNKKRIIFTSVLTIMVCLAIVSGSTYALFTDNDTSVNVAITAGDFSVKATPVDGDDNDTDVDFTIGSDLEDSNGNKLSPIGTAEFKDNKIQLSNMVPGDHVTFKVDVTNEGTVAAACRVVIKQETVTPPANSGISNEDANKLWNALTVTIKHGDTVLVDNKKVSEMTLDSNNEIDLNDSFILDAKNGTTTSATFEIKISFPNANDNNDYIGTGCGLTYAVYATQYNKPQNP